jgi:hypothetical protein
MQRLGSYNVPLPFKNTKVSPFGRGVKGEDGLRRCNIHSPTYFHIPDDRIKFHIIATRIGSNP